MIESDVGVLATLLSVAAGFFLLEQRTAWRGFRLFPPLLFIYATPLGLTNAGLLTSTSPVYESLSDIALPMLICLMLLTVRVSATVRVMGSGVLVMLLGTVGVVVGGVLAYAVVHPWLQPDAWRGFGALAGSWIGGTGNMAATAKALATSPEELGLAVLADNVVYMVWLPILLGSKAFADRFNRWTRAPEDRLAVMESAARELAIVDRIPTTRDYLYLLALGLSVAWAGEALADRMPDWPPVLTPSTWNVLIITTISLGLSATPARALPGSQNLAVALVYVFVAGMGARASIEGIEQAPAFLLGAFIWIAVHGLFVLAGAWLFRVDVHTVAIASAANIGGAASAPVVAAHHRQALVPAAILMAILGYALGNYLAIATGQLARWVVQS